MPTQPGPRMRNRPVIAHSPTRVARRSRVSAFLLTSIIPLAIAGCSTVPEAVENIDFDVVKPSGFQIKPPWASVTPQGVRFQGWVCRAQPLGRQSPRRLRAERLAADGSIEAFAIGLGPQVPPRIGCRIYMISTDWQVDAVRRIRVCRDTGSPCRTTGTLAKSLIAP